MLKVKAVFSHSDTSRQEREKMLDGFQHRRNTKVELIPEEEAPFVVEVSAMASHVSLIPTL